ncbi:unnamed protein product [Alopecurus aequalis]
MARASSSSCSLAVSSFLALLLVAALSGERVAMAQRMSAAAPVSVRVGVILNWASAVSRRRRTDIEMAVEDYYAAHPGLATRLELHFRDSAGDVVGAAAAAVDLINNAQVHAIIGPQTSSQAEFVAHLGNRSHVPVLSYSATSPSVSPAQTPYFVCTAANDSFQAVPVAAILDAFGWRAVAVLHEDSPYGAGILPALADALENVGVRGAAIVDRVAVPSYSSDESLDVILYRLMAMPTRVLVDTLGPEDVDAMQGVVSLRPHVELTDEVRNFSARFIVRFRRDNPGVEDAAISDPNVMRFWAYDTAWALAAAAEAADALSGPAFHTPPGRASTPQNADLDRISVSATGAALLRAVLNTTFDGMAGKFRMVDGQMQVATYEVVNIIGRGARMVGFWTPKSGLSRELNGGGGKAPSLKHILWPGETPSTPKGWTASQNGRVLNVAVPVKRGFKQFVNVVVSPNSTTTITGYCIDVFDKVMKNLAYPVPYRYVPFHDSPDSYDMIVDLVRDGKADIVVGDLTITADRLDEVDFTMPFTESGWSMVVAARPDTTASMWIFLKPLTASLWITSLAFFIFTGFVVWVIEHRVNPEFRGTPLQQFGLCRNHYRIGTNFLIFYFAFSTLVFAHKEKLESNLSRLVVIIWVFVVLILTSSYTASLTSMLTVQKLQPTVADVTELQRRGHYIGYKEGSFIEPFLKKMGFDQRKFREYSTVHQYADALSKGSANGGVDAVFDEMPYLKLFLSQYCDGYMRVGPVYKTDGFGFVFPRGSPMVSDVSRGIVRLAEGDEMARIEKAWFGEPGTCRTAPPVGSANLSFQNFGGLFLITGVVSTLMLLVYLAIFAYREHGELRAADAEGTGSGSLSVRRMKAWLQHYDRRDLKSPTFKMSNEESLRNGGAFSSRTPTAREEEHVMGRASPLSVYISSGMNAGSSPEGTPTSEISE